MSFTGYPKINETLKVVGTTAGKVTPSGMKWAVTEKVHGANFCFIYNVSDKSFSFAKRRAVLDANEDFFGFKTSDTFQKTCTGVRNCCDRVLEKLSRGSDDGTESIQKILVFGELFGGNGTRNQVQSGIYYSPHLHFYIFDISVSTDSVGREASVTRFLDYDTLLSIFKEDKYANSDVLFATPLTITDTYEEAANYSLGFETTLPGRLGIELPASVPRPNKAEGIVIRPMKEMGREFLVKYKIPGFQEIAAAAASHDKKGTWSAPLSSSSSSSSFSSSRPWIEFFEDMSTRFYITPQRVESVTSKVGTLTAANRTEFLAEFVNDIVEDLKRDYEYEWQMLEQTEFIDAEKECRKSIEVHCNSFLDTLL
jgi:Rnl2 family RNA ligase